MFLLICSGCATSSQTLPDEAFDQIRRSPLKASLPPLFAAAKSNNIILIKNLLLSGEDVNRKDHDGKSALWYAFDYENYEAFKVLLENGATPYFLTYEMASGTYSKMELYKLAKEYNLLNRIKNHRNDDDVTVFDAYFSEFSNGHYVSEAEQLFEAVVRRDYGKIRTSGSVKDMQQFMEKYSSFGHHCYLIMVSDLNIRAGNSTTAEIIGKYIKGDRVFARVVRDGWIQTDRGWISSQYAKQIKKTIPLLHGYLREISSKTGLSRKPDTPGPATQTGTESRQMGTESRQPEIRYQQPEIVPPKVIRGGKVAAVQKELEAILKHPTLRKLELFINKYKNNKACQFLVKKAKEEYQKLLLGDL